MKQEDFVGRAILSAEAPDTVRAPSRLKSRIFSAMQKEQAAGGPLRSLSQTKSDGRSLCVFEELLQIAPVGESVKSRNPCRVCHARILGERVEGAPIWWPHCPYVDFQNR